MSQFIKFYLTSYVLNMFRILIYPSSGAATFLLYHHIGRVLCKDGGFYRTHNQCGDTIEKSQLLMMDVLMSETC